MFVDLWSVHMDPNSWPDPYDYKPERHLNPDGTLMRSDRILSFGSGNMLTKIKFHHLHANREDGG